MPTLTDLSPRYLIPHERNLRTDVGDVADLMASITAVGILQPLLVVPLPPEEYPAAPSGDGRRAPAEDTGDAPGWFQIIVGHRRHAAAVHLGLETVPCLIAADEGEARRLVIMLAENTARVGLSASAPSGIASGASFGELGVVAASGGTGSGSACWLSVAGLFGVSGQ